MTQYNWMLVMEGTFSADQNRREEIRRKIYDAVEAQLLNLSRPMALGGQTEIMYLETGAMRTWGPDEQRPALSIAPETPQSEEAQSSGR